MSRSLFVRAAWRHWWPFPSAKFDWFAALLVGTSVLFLVTSPLLALFFRMFLEIDRTIAVTYALVLLLCIEAFLLCCFWQELPRRRRAEAAIGRMNSMQRAISMASGRIVSMRPDELEHGLRRELCAIREMLNIDGVSWFQRSESGQSYKRLQYSLDSSYVAFNESFLVSISPWISEQLLQGVPVHLRNINDLPPEAAKERQILQCGGIKSLAVIPSRGGLCGANALVLTSFSKEISWDRKVIEQLSVLASVFANAKARELAEVAGGESESRFRHLFEDSPLGLALLDSTGQIRVANNALARFLGRTVVELSAQSIFGLTVPSEIPQVWLHLQELLAGVREIRQVERKFLRKDGSATWGRVTLSMAGGKTGTERFVMAMVEDVTESMATREQLEQSKHMLTMALDASRTVAWEYDPHTDVMNWLDRNRNTAKTTEAPRSEYFSNILQHVVPDDWALLRALIKSMLQTGGIFSTEFRMIGRDGTIRWMLGKGQLYQKSPDAHPKIVGVTMDISHLKRAQVELQQLAKRLMQAQEEERKRISLELHDDIGQRVALLAIELDLVQQQLNGNEMVRDRVARAQFSAEEIGSDIHQISHSLHSSKLKYLGLPAAVREFCSLISETHGLAIEFGCAEQKPNLTEEEALALFRVAQEALNNAARHSHAGRVKVLLSFSEMHAMLSVADDGVGFNSSDQCDGIGLIGMRERVRSIGGELRIVSTPGSGTELQAILTFLEPRVLKQPLATAATAF
jgi:PAS domain S-box-containing protein